MSLAISSQTVRRTARFTTQDRSADGPLSPRELSKALNHISQGLCMFDAAANIILCNDAYVRMYGLSARVVRPGCSLQRLIAHRQEVGYLVHDVHQYVESILNDVRTGQVVARRDDTRDGRIIKIINHPIPGGGWVSTHEDVTERSIAERKVEFMASHDALTNLPNRAKLLNAIDREFAQQRRSGEMIALLAIDLDGFKAVNDSLGHPVGDSLLQEVARRLTRQTRASDTVARHGGDEFAVLQTFGERGVEPASALAARVVRSVSEPYWIGGHNVTIGASIGIAFGPDDGDTPETLIQSADFALYRAKSEGRNRFRFFEAAMRSEARARLALEGELREAVRLGELEVHYQTIFAAESGEMCGAEALVRWRRGEREAIGPDKFIPIAEATGLIFPIGEWVLRTACRQATQWPPGLRISVNLSPVQFKIGDLVGVVRDCLAQSGLAPGRLELEITESVLIDASERNLAQLRAIKDLGVSIALDDFGTGFSSLGHLRKFPIDVIKIDRSFVRDIATRPESASTIRAVIDLGKSLGLTTVAEGVETLEQFAQLRRAGCTLVQGFAFSRPRPAPDVDFSMSAPVADGGAPPPPQS